MNNLRKWYKASHRDPTCGVEASQLAMDTVDVEPGSDLFAFLDAGVGTQ